MSIRAGGREIGAANGPYIGYREKELLMKKQSKKWTIRAAAFALAAVCLCGGVALAAGGDQDDPLITLSYLTKTATPDILEQVEEQADQRQIELLQKFNASIDEYKKQAPQSSGAGSSSATYTVVTLSNGQRLSLGVGCEVMLRVGSAAVSANTSPALIDVSTGGSLNSGGTLTANHLYMATISDRFVTATAETVKLMVRGEYTVA